MKKLLLFTLSLCFLVTNISAENTKADSLLNILKTNISDSAKVNIYNKLFDIYEFSDTVQARSALRKAETLSSKAGYQRGLAYTYMNLGFLNEDRSLFSEAKHYHDKSLKIFEILKLNSNKTIETDAMKGIARCYKNIGNIYYYRSNFDSALIFARKAISISEKIGDKYRIAVVFMNMGSIYLNMGEHLQSIVYFQKSLKMSESINDQVNPYKCLMNIGIVYLFQKNYPNAIDYFQKSLKLAEEMNDRTVVSNCYVNLGLANSKLGNLKQSINYYLKSLKIKEELGDKAGVAANLINIGTNYYYSKNFSKALEYDNKALDILKEIGDKERIGTVYLNMSDLKFEEGKFNDAIIFIDKGFAIGKEINSLEIIKCSYENYSRNYEKMGNLKKALDNHKLFKEFNDSIFNTESGNQIKEMEAKYQNEKKQKEIELKNTQLSKSETEVKQQRTQKLAFITGFALMLLLSIVIFKSYRDKKKANIILAEQKQLIEDKNEELNQQNEEIRTQRDEIEAQRDEISSQRDLVTTQKNEIEYIHEELKDSIHYAQRIQNAVLPPNDFINSILPDHFILFKPKDIVSGDFYWIAKRHNYILIAVADCTGHGVPGGFMSMLGISFLNEIIIDDNIMTASQVLDKLRKYVVKSLQQKGIEGEQKDGMDIAFIALNTETNELQFAGANNPLYVIASGAKQSLSKEAKSIEDLTLQIASPSVRNDDQGLVERSLRCIEPVEISVVERSLSVVERSLSVVEVKGDKQPVAIYENMKPFTNHVIQLQKGDTIYLMSDGFEDQFGGPKGKKFYSKNVKDLLTQYAHLPMDSQKEILNKTIEDWIFNYPVKFEQTDDITVMGIRI